MKSFVVSLIHVNAAIAINLEQAFGGSLLDRYGVNTGYSPFRNSGSQ